MSEGRAYVVQVGHLLPPTAMALLEPQFRAARRQLRVDYLSRGKGAAGTLRIHSRPGGAPSVSYLIGTANDYDDLRQFALHRLLRVELLEEKARDTDSGELDCYIAGGAFSARCASETVELVAEVHPHIAWLLNETPLSRQHKKCMLSECRPASFKKATRLVACSMNAVARPFFV